LPFFLAFFEKSFFDENARFFRLKQSKIGTQNLIYR
jgi:hypothetical protein